MLEVWNLKAESEVTSVINVAGIVSEKNIHRE